MKLLITGGAGFIGSAVIRHLIGHTTGHVVNVDKLTYAGNLDSLSGVSGSDRYAFEHADICDRAAVDRVLERHEPDAIMHLAAESHVDRSIDAPGEFIRTNIDGTYTLLEASLGYWQALPAVQRARFRFHHVSTDEVFGDLADDAPPFTEMTAYRPNSPYAASKAASDHLARSWQRSFGLPVVISHCSNNYGPCQFPEKLIPLMILNAIEGRPLPVYGDGANVRDWLYVDDHVRALLLILARGAAGETYNVGSHTEKRNMDVVRTLCDILEEMAPARPAGVEHYRDLITHVPDRPGHDRRYAIDAGRIRRELGWTPATNFEDGLRMTVRWYLDNAEWCRRVRDGSYRRERPGLSRSGAAR